MTSKGQRGSFFQADSPRKAIDASAGSRTPMHIQVTIRRPGWGLIKQTNKKEGNEEGNSTENGVDIKRQFIKEIHVANM